MFNSSSLLTAGSLLAEPLDLSAGSGKLSSCCMKIWLWSSVHKSAPGSLASFCGLPRETITGTIK